ncbi:insulinase family protein [Rhodobacteraceae bacterium RKSG542]|uniref:M16 family metallopeptidase n=1 Tax=Pseudovibrio flavus TaxID=2529854 RepID=UPI0012BCBA71|nr:pitrilysin family protein [Pseudovibrio flavus]MTI18605.1 insulinase family protein [Pseudovibrio flavus]
MTKAGLLVSRSVALVSGGLMLMLSVVSAQAIEIQRVVSDQGIEAWLVEDYSVPIVAMEYSFQGGTTQDADDKLGATNLLSTMLDEGAGELDSQAFQLKLEELTMSLGFNAGRDRFYGSMRTLQVNLPEALEMLTLAVNEPRFDEAPLERMRAQVISGLKREEKRPQSIAGRKFSALLYPDSQYGRPSKGTVESVEKLQASDLKAQRDKLFARDGLKVGVVGAIDAETLKKALDQVFAKLPEKTQLTEVKNVLPLEGKSERVDFDTPQTTIQFALPGLKRDDPQYIPAFVMNHILGGGSFSSWLYQEVREKRGLAYSVGSYLVPLEHTALLMGSTSTRADNADEVLKVIEEQMVKMGEEGPTAEELEKAKAYLTGSYALNFDSSGAIARQLLGIQNAGLGIDYINKRNDLIDDVTLEAVREVARDLFAGQEPSIMVVGPQTAPKQ